MLQWFVTQGWVEGDLARLFDSLMFRSAFALFFSFLIVVVFGRWFIGKLRNAMLIDIVNQDLAHIKHDHEGKKTTPTMGGILIIGSALLSGLICADFTNSLVVLSLLVLILFSALGSIDDWVKLKRLQKHRGITGAQKLIAQFCCAGLILWLYIGSANHDTIRPLLPFMRWDSDGGMWQYLFPFLTASVFCIWFMLIMVGSSNAVNLTDGLDGLATGVTLSTVITFAFLSYSAGNFILAEHFGIAHIAEAGELTVTCACVVGALAGFLLFNSHKASVFMGDTGSLPLGAFAAAVALFSKMEWTLPVVGGIFVLEAFSVILQVSVFKITKGKRIFKCSPYHHHLQQKGYSENKIVVSFWIIGGLLCIAGLAMLRLR